MVRRRVLRHLAGRAALVIHRPSPNRSGRDADRGPQLLELYDSPRCHPGHRRMMSKSLSQAQFGQNAAEYLTSKPHAQGKSLDRLVALTCPQPHWQALDIATGAGHTAYAFAPHVARQWATDITDEMLSLVRGEVAKRKLANMRVAQAKAEALPFGDASFDLVSCRVAPHHF